MVLHTYVTLLPTTTTLPYTSGVLLLATTIISTTAYTASPTHTVSHLATLAFTVSTLVFLYTVHALVLLLSFELLNVPLAVLLLYRNTGQLTGIASSPKSTHLALTLLLSYGLLSGVCLFLGLSMVSTATAVSLTVLGTPLVTTYTAWTVMISGGIKAALVPTHVWLGKVHVECSTIGSVLLAGIALKAGWYIHVLYSSSLQSHLGTAQSHLSLVLVTLLLIGGAYTSLVLARQQDTKRWVALYSITHMQVFYALWLLASLTDHSTITLTLGMYGHSLISSGMFYVCGTLADSYGTREWSSISVTGILSGLLLVLILLNGSIPGSVLLLVELSMVSVCLPSSVLLSVCGLAVSATSIVTGLYVYLRTLGSSELATQSTLRDRKSVV